MKTCILLSDSSVLTTWYLWFCIITWGGKGSHHWPACYKRLLYMVGLPIRSATISWWTAFPASYCNCEIQDGIQDDHHSYAVHWKIHSHSVFRITQSNVNRFKKNFHKQIARETFSKTTDSCLRYVKCIAHYLVKYKWLKLPPQCTYISLLFFNHEERTGLL